MSDIFSAQKTPADILDWAFNYATEGTELNDGTAADTGFLQGDTIATSDWIAYSPVGTVVVGDEGATTKKTSAKLSGGDEGMLYRIVNTITTAAGNTKTRTLYLEIVNE